MIDFALSNKFGEDVIISNDLLLVLQQIDLLFATDTCDVLGDMNYGTNYDKYLYTVGMSNAAMEQKIYNDLQKLDLKNREDLKELFSTCYFLILYFKFFESFFIF